MNKAERKIRHIGTNAIDVWQKMPWFSRKWQQRNNAVTTPLAKESAYERAQALATTNLAHLANRPVSAIPKSSLCTQADMESEWLAFWREEINANRAYHRKIWEFCYIAQACWASDMLTEGKSGLGFGCGDEPLPSLFAKYKATILATDLDPAWPGAEGWVASGRYASPLDAVLQPNICPDKLLTNIRFKPVDMREIPPELESRFDFCWSSSVLEHLGSLKAGWNFIENALITLKPAGVAVHTTEFNLDYGKTIHHGKTVLYQRHHFIELADRLTKQGHHVVPFEFNPGTDELDRFVDIPPFRSEEPQFAHLKLMMRGHRITSAGLIIHKAA